MVFTKSFPITSDKSYTRWEEVALSEEEEAEQEKLAREENISKMKESIDDARQIMKEKNLKEYQTDMIHIAITLFEKRGSHEIYYKENRAKELFDSRQ
jgi:queuine/archaeosine tRNA-ribosyltransferase